MAIDISDTSWTKNWIIFEEGKWYFYDPINDRFGPYETEEECKIELLKYSEFYGT